MTWVRVSWVAEQLHHCNPLKLIPQSNLLLGSHGCVGSPPINWHSCYPRGAPVGASGKVHQELGLWARDDEGDPGVCLMSRYWASWQGSGRGMAEAEWDFFSCKSSCEAIHRLWDSSWVTSCYWRLVYSRCCSMVSLSVSVEHKDSSINFTETGDICHLSVLLWPFYNLMTSAGGWGATAPLIGHQLSVLLPSHLAGMCF